MPRTRSIGVFVLAVSLTAALVTFGLYRHVQRDRLRVIVQDQCLPQWRALHQAGPCSSVEMFGNTPDARGVAVLHDRKGGAHFLLIPTRTISGIESPEARDPRAPNYFAEAWKARHVLESVTGFTVPDTTVGLAVNQFRARSQDQLHIHISCLRPSAFEGLARDGPHVGLTWKPMELDGHSYFAMRVMGETLASANPIRLLSEGVPGARDRLSDYTLLVAGASFVEGPGFLVLAARDAPGAELLLDATCASAHRATSMQ
jgi:CDP-diacylglycerol pyrophosphatase